MGFASGRYFLVSVLSGALVQACGGETGPIGRGSGDEGSGGSGNGGAASGSGGAPATGGSKAGSGGISSGGFVGGGGKATGGTIGTGGKATGGTVGTGGRSTGGTTGTGGKSTGGSDGVSDCFGASNDCLRCVHAACCDEYLACGSDANCSQKSSSEPGEMLCIQDCIIDAVSQSGIVDLQACAATCAEDSSGVSPATSALVACMRDEGEDGLQACSTVCFGTELP
jgi:hypothetical protein